MLDVPALTSELSKLGFRPTNDIDTIRYEGPLNCHGQTVPIYLDITDPELVKLPDIYLIERPSKLPKVCGHLGSDNKLCYAQNSLAFIDRYHPIPAIIGCMEQAKELIEKLMAGDPLNDTQDEFSYYWDGSPVLVDVETDKPGATKFWYVKLLDWPNEGMICCSDIERAEEKFQLLNTEIDRRPALLYLVNAENAPKVWSSTWPLRTLSEFINWTKQYDHSVYQAFLSALEDWHKSKLDIMGLFVRHPTAWYGISFHRPAMRQYKHANDFNHAILTKHAHTIKINRLQPYRIDTDYLVGRNIPNGQKMLKDFNIALIGCGAIGGYLANTIACSGAGFGHGCLHLIDNDILLPGNLGRHWLGFPDLYQAKVIGLENKLKKYHPGIQVTTHYRSGVNMPELGDMDIILDATATEAFSHWLNQQIISNNYPPTIYSWIVGNGIAAQSYILHDKKQACYRCLRISDENSEYSPIKKGVELDISYAGGCDAAFIPFSPSAALHAAALASQLLLDWANEQIKQPLRTVLIDIDNTKSIPKKNPTKWKQCPACNQ